jgi:hypothetical protein
VLPDQVLPDQVLPLQVLPLQVDPDQVEPDQVLPLQVDPDQVEPDQVDPLKTPPFQALAVFSAEATPALQACPKMSCSPVSATPPRDTWLSPRACSSEPVPSAAGKDWSEPPGTRLRTAAAVCTSPDPTKFSFELLMSVAVLVSSAFTWSGERPGRTLSTSATTPETMAAACEVPEPRRNRLLKTAPGLAFARTDPGDSRPIT